MGVGKTPGRHGDRRAADMGIYPDDDADCYEPPPGEETEVIPYYLHLALGHKAGVSQVFRKGTTELVNFAVWQDVHIDGAWQHVVRIDSWHGNVHRHDFTRDGNNRRTILEAIPPDHAERVIEVWCDRAEHDIMAEWEDNVRRWQGDGE